MMRRLIFGAIALFSLCIVIHAQSAPKGPADADELLRPLSIRFGSRFWTRAPSEQFGLAWTADTLKPVASYSKAADAIDIRFAADNADGLVESLKLKAASSQNDPVALFSWAYSSIKQSSLIAQKGRNYWQEANHFQDLGTMVWLMAAAKNAGGAEYTRLRFILEAGLSSRTDLMPLGRKLLQVNPNDESVLRTIAYQLSLSKSERDLDEAMHIVDQLIAKKPDRLSYVGLKGLIYQSRWYALGNKPADGRKMIEWDKKYISMAPRGCSNSQGKQRMIDIVREALGG